MPLTLDLMGIYIPTFGVGVVLVMLLLFVVRWILDRLGVFALFWHRGLVDVCLFVLLLGGLLLLTNGPSVTSLFTF